MSELLSVTRGFKIISLLCLFNTTTRVQGISQKSFDIKKKSVDYDFKKYLEQNLPYLKITKISFFLQTLGHLKVNLAVSFFQYSTF